MPVDETFPLARLDYAAIVAYFVLLSAIGLWAGRKKKTQADDYFLAGRTLPWYVVGSSFVASNISTEHFIGMIGAAFVYGICVAMSEWANVLSFSVLIWFFIPFLLASRVFTTPEFMERRFHPALRQVLRDPDDRQQRGGVSGRRALRRRAGPASAVRLEPAGSPSSPWRWSPARGRSTAGSNPWPGPTSSP
jgi:hypothetical protein